MSENKWAEVLVIAGFDPSAGAGLLADTKTLEQHQIYALNVCTAITVQNDVQFEQVIWQDLSLIKQQISLLFQRFQPKVCKIGLIENWAILHGIIDYVLSLAPSMQIVLDPIFRASAGFTFHAQTHWEYLAPILSKITLITPNLPELEAICQGEDKETVLYRMSQDCAVLLKGGHATIDKGTDYLYQYHRVQALPPPTVAKYEKHGSGCVLSAAIAANLAKELPLWQSCQNAKVYMANFLNSNPTLLGYHNHTES